MGEEKSIVEMQREIDGRLAALRKPFEHITVGRRADDLSKLLNRLCQGVSNNLHRAEDVAKAERAAQALRCAITEYAHGAIRELQIEIEVLKAPFLDALPFEDVDVLSALNAADPEIYGLNRLKKAKRNDAR